MDQNTIIQYISETFTGVDLLRPEDGPGAGDTFFIYDPERNLPPRYQIPFATIVTKDYGDFDNASQLDRSDVYRLNIGVSRDTYRQLLGHAPSSVNEVRASYDFAALDRLMPHPIYAAQSWVCVLNPSEERFEAVKPLLAEAYAIATDRHSRRQSRSS